MAPVGSALNWRRRTPGTVNATPRAAASSCAIRAMHACSPPVPPCRHGARAGEGAGEAKDGGARVARVVCRPGGRAEWTRRLVRQPARKDAAGLPAGEPPDAQPLSFAAHRLRGRCHRGFRHVGRQAVRRGCDCARKVRARCKVLLSRATARHSSDTMTFLTGAGTSTARTTCSRS